MTDTSATARSARFSPMPWLPVVVWALGTQIFAVAVTTRQFDTSVLSSDAWAVCVLVLLVGWHAALRATPLRPHGFGRILIATAAALVQGRWMLSAISAQHANLIVPILIAIALVHGLGWAIGARSAPAWLRAVAGIPCLVVGALVPIGFALDVVHHEGLTGNFIPLIRIGAPRSASMPSVPADAGEMPLPLDAVPGAADSPQFFGPARDGRVAGVELATDWQAHPPEPLWRAPVGASWSGFAVRGRRAVTHEQYEDDDAITCRDLATGVMLWIHVHRGDLFEHPVGGDGARGTPAIATVDGEALVFAMNANGVVDCLRLADGAPVWSVAVTDRFEAVRPQWGFASSPLVVERGDGRALCIVTSGARRRDGELPPCALVALDAGTGETVWTGGAEPLQYSSPVLAELAGVRQVLILGDSLRAHDLETGAVLWRHPWKSGHPHVAMPAVLDGGEHVVFGTGYGTGTARIRVTRGPDGSWRTEEVWQTRRFKPKFANFVVHDGHVYGYDDGVLACIGAERGRLRWKQRSTTYGHGQLLLVGDVLLATTERPGAVALVAADPDDFRELARLEAFEGDAVMWNPPTLAGRYLLLRNAEQAVCYRLPTR